MKKTEIYKSLHLFTNFSGRKTLIWMYTVKGKEFIATDIASLTQLMDVANTQWVWIDIFDPIEKELEILTELIGNEPKVIEGFKVLLNKPLDINLQGCILCNYERIKDFTFITIPSISINEKMIVHPIILGKKKKMVITWGEEDRTHSKIIKKVIKRLREGVEAEQSLNSSLVIALLFHEIAVKNANEILGIKEKIDDLEQKALENGGKQLFRSIFGLKKIISNLYRIMIEEKDFMLDVDKSVIPLIKLDQKSRSIVDEAIDITDREIDFLDSYNRSLDSILTLQDLASIHKVESSINYLTIVLVIGTAILVLLELAVVLELL